MTAINQYLADHRFAELFREELGWDRMSGKMALEIDGRQLSFESIAQKRGFHILHCGTDRRALFNKGLLRKAQRQITKSVDEHVVIYSCDGPPKQVWQWSIRLPDGRQRRHGEHLFFSNSPPAPFLSRLSYLRFSIDDECDASLADVLDRVRAALGFSADLDLFPKRPRYAERSDELAVAMANGEPDAFDRFVLFHRPLARHLSNWLQRSYGVDADDAVQVGMIGIIEAARRFEPNRGLLFSTYAHYWVRQTCQRYGIQSALFIHLPIHLAESLFMFRRRLDKIASKNDPAFAKEEFTRRAKADGTFFALWRGFKQALNVRSLSDPHSPEYRQAHSLVAPAFDPLDQEISAERAATIRTAIDRLKPRDRRFVLLRHGIDSAPHTLEEIGRAEGITRERVRQILNRAEEWLCRWLSRELDIVMPAAEPANQTDSDSLTPATNC